jgi:histidinol-phosphate/aromatic aminotransferase/cobyric acid decarboxylase-like protein
MIQPFTSWANFVLARVERGDADLFAAELHRRGISVHRPCHPELRDHFRITATSIEATTALKNALIAVASDI